MLLILYISILNELFDNNFEFTRIRPVNLYFDALEMHIFKYFNVPRILKSELNQY